MWSRIAPCGSIATMKFFVPPASRLQCRMRRQPSSSERGEAMTETLLGAYVFFLAIIVGFQVIGRVPAMLHTPLMSGTNAIHGVVLVSGILVAGQANSTATRILGFVAVLLGSLNVFGGFVVTNRMLEMFHAAPGKRS